MQILHLHEIFNVTIYNLFYNNLIKNHLHKYIFYHHSAYLTLVAMPQVVFLSKGQGIKTTDYRLQTTDYGLQTTDFRPSTFDR